MLCPVASLINTSIDGLYSYPIDIFDINHYQLLNSTSHLYQCSSNTEEPFPSKHYCSSSLTYCPISWNQLITSRYKSISYSKHSLWYIYNILTNQSINNETIRIIILGGSATLGMGNSGCCCDETLDIKCSNIRYNKQRCKSYQSEEYSITCQWSNYLYKYLYITYPYHSIEIYNLAHGGYSSDTMSENIIDKLYEYKIYELYSSDIIFIDHSTNDATLTKDQLHYQHLMNGLDNLIYKLLLISKTYLWPSIILLETYPYPQNNFTKMKDFYNYEYDYTKAYDIIAMKYHLPIWSLRDILWLTYNTSLSSMIYIQYLQHHHTKGLYYHPTWYHHLYQSDLYSSLLEYEFSILSNKHNRSYNDMNILLYQINKSDNEYCDIKIKPILFISAEHILKQQHIIGNYSMNPINSWDVIQDRKDKYGFITQLINPYPNPNPNPTFNNTKPNPNTLCNDKYSSSLFFSFHIPYPKTYMKYILTIQYMRTYYNAGQVDLYICNKYFKTYDALWPNYKLFHFTTPEIVKYVMGGLYGYDINYWCNGQSYGYLEFKHKCKLQGIEEEESIVRNEYKFKIMKVKICQTNIEGDVGNIQMN